MAVYKHNEAEGNIRDHELNWLLEKEYESDR
jgi:hypothetical protein